MPIELILSVVAFTACTRFTPDVRLSRAADPPTIRGDCEVATHRCSQCHSLDRVVALEPASPTTWTSYVRRMRFMPGSAIDARDEQRIVSCLQYRSFGATEVAP